MREIIELTGMVLKSTPVGETDRRAVILTKERGKITAFAHGAKRPGNPLMAVCRPFVFGRFRLYEGRESYNLQSADISNYFTEITENMETACYASYFLELADYFGREGIEASETLLLLYQSMRALLKPALPNALVQRIFELRILVINGEYTEQPPGQAGDSARYAWEYIIAAPLERLYTFILREDAQKELSENIEILKKKFLDHPFHSLEILKMMQDGY